MFHAKVVEKFQTHLCSIIFFFQKNGASYKIMWKIWKNQGGHKEQQ